MNIYDEKENFNRIISWNSPFFVPTTLPSRGIVYPGASAGHNRPSPRAGEWKDIWGVTWIDADGEVFPSGPAISSVEDINRYQPPDPHAPSIAEGLEEQASRIDRNRFFLSVAHRSLLYHKGFNIMGPEGFLMALATGDAAPLLDKIIGFELGIAEEYVRFRPDHLNTSDDFGMQDRLVVSPQMWRRLFKPRLKKLYDFYRDRLGDGLVISHHSCGHVMPILEDFIELGVNILHPVQTAANDLGELRRRTSRRLVLAGGIDGQQVLPLGSPAQVREEVFRKLDMLWEGGGYLPMPEKMLGVSACNKEAMHEAIREWSRLNVES